MSDSKREIEKIVYKFIAQISNNPETPTYIGQEDDGNIEELVQAISELIVKAKIEENQRYLDNIKVWNNRKPVPGELTASSFGSAGASMIAFSYKNSFTDRISELTSTLKGGRNE